jgi:hypothetical protein
MCSLFYNMIRDVDFLLIQKGSSCKLHSFSPSLINYISISNVLTLYRPICFLLTRILFGKYQLRIVDDNLYEFE